MQACLLRRANAQPLERLPAWLTGGSVSLGGSREQPLQIPFRYIKGWKTTWRSWKAKSRTHPQAHGSFCTEPVQAHSEGNNLIPSRDEKEASLSLSRWWWGDSPKQNNYLSFASHLTSCVVNNGKRFRNVSRNLCFIRDVLHLVWAHLP